MFTGVNTRGWRRWGPKPQAYSQNIVWLSPSPLHLRAAHTIPEPASQIKRLQVTRSGLPPTVLSAAHTVQGASGNGNDFLPLQPLDLPRSSNMVVRSMAQPVIITFAPAHKETRNLWVQSHLVYHPAPPSWSKHHTARHKPQPVTEITFQSTKRQLK